MIRAGGYELMNSRMVESELELARVGYERMCRENHHRVCRAVIAGLGLGFTLAEFLRRTGDLRSLDLTVVEVSAEVLDWYKTHFRPNLHADIQDQSVNFRVTDILDFLNGARDLDLVLLDVDNGPAPITQQSNSKLYEAEGLTRLHRALRSGGQAIFWSGFRDEEFNIRLRNAGFAVDEIIVDLGRSHHHLICLKKPKGAC
ncbi:MAG: hypothetical protein AB7F86_00140 [Bdellovibrionales bacterium]